MSFSTSFIRAATFDRVVSVIRNFGAFFEVGLI
jgi:hypothetical protein